MVSLRGVVSFFGLVVLLSDRGAQLGLLELGSIQTHVSQKPLLWVKAGAHLVAAETSQPGIMFAQNKTGICVANMRQQFCSVIVTTATNLIATSP